VPPGVGTVLWRVVAVPAVAGSGRCCDCAVAALGVMRPQG